MSDQTENPYTAYTYGAGAGSSGNASGEIKYCRICGAGIPADSEYCPKCGCTPRPFEGRPEPDANVSPKSRLAASILAFFPGCLGIHRFYVGKVGSGIAELFVGWMTLGISPLIDFIMIVCGRFTDGDGKLIKNWDAD